MGNIIFYALLVALVSYVGRAWLRWSRTETKFAEPRWRSGLSVCGLAFGTISLSLIVALAVHALITGGFPYYHPILMLALFAGFLTALAGLIAALIGKSELDVPAAVCSGICLLIWLAEAVAQ